MITENTLQQYLLRHRSDGQFLGSGATRVAYYCKKYDRVFKYSIQGWDTKEHQSKTEYLQAQRLPDHYKKFIPVEQYAIVKYENRDVEVIVMLRAKAFSDDRNFIESWYREHRNYRDIYEFAANYYHMGLRMADEFRQFLQDHRISDISNSNIGICQDHFVVIDAGIMD
jgi:hypothetical protein